MIINAEENWGNWKKWGKNITLIRVYNIYRSTLEGYTFCPGATGGWVAAEVQDVPGPQPDRPVLHHGPRRGY